MKIFEVYITISNLWSMISKFIVLKEKFLFVLTLRIFKFNFFDFRMQKFVLYYIIIRITNFKISISPTSLTFHNNTNFILLYTILYRTIFKFIPFNIFNHIRRHKFYWIMLFNNVLKPRPVLRSSSTNITHIT